MTVYLGLKPRATSKRAKVFGDAAPVSTAFCSSARRARSATVVSRTTKSTRSPMGASSSTVFNVSSPPPPTSTFALDAPGETSTSTKRATHDDSGTMIDDTTNSRKT